MFAVIKTGGKQYRISVGDIISVEKLMADAGETVTLDSVLMHGEGDSVTVGAPFVDGAVVTAEVLEQYRGDKVVGLKKRRRKHSSARRWGHRQSLTKLRISGIPGDADGSAGAAKRAAAKKAAPAKPATEDAASASLASMDKPGNLMATAPETADDLTKLPGWGQVAQGSLNELGVYTYAQVTGWGPADWDYIEAFLEERHEGRVETSRTSILTQANRLVETRGAAANETSGE